VASQDRTSNPYALGLVVFVIMVSLLLLTILFLFVSGLSDEIRWGTVADWVGAMGAVIVGVAALYFAFKAGQATELAAKAEMRSTFIAEQGVASQVRFSFEVVGGAQVGGTQIRLSTSPTSPRVQVAILIPDRFDFPNVADTDLIREWEIGFRRALETFERHWIPSGGSLSATWRHVGYGPMGDGVRQGASVTVIPVINVTESPDADGHGGLHNLFNQGPIPLHLDSATHR
jgi:hypothetical protein